jgi:hypothetical protein
MIHTFSGRKGTKAQGLKGERRTIHKQRTTHGREMKGRWGDYLANLTTYVFLLLSFVLNIIS